MKSIQILMDEHQLILRAIEIAQKMAFSFEEQQRIDQKKLHSLVHFIKMYADHFHHKKEEDVLFKWMQEKGFPLEGGPLACMLSEHDTARNHIQSLEAELEKNQPQDPASVQSVVRSLGEISRLYKDHIFKEDNILYPMATQMADETGDEEILQRYLEKLSHEENQKTNQKFQEIIEHLEEKYQG